MSSRMVRRNIESLHNEIADVEQKLQDVLKSKSKKSGTGRNETASREIELFVTGPSGKKLPTAIVKPDTLFRARKASSKCVDVFENNDGTVKVTVERKNSLENRRRSRSTPEVNRCTSADDDRTTKSSENMKKVPDRRSTTGAVPRKVKPTPRPLHQSWGDVLDGKRRSENVIQQPRKTQQGSVIRKPSEKLDGNFVKPPFVVPTVQRKDSNKSVEVQNAVASGTSVSKSNCSESIPQNKPQHDSPSASPSSSSCYRSTVASVSHNIQSAIPHSGQPVENEPFALFNPVTTLNFLVKELRGIVRKNSTPTCVTRVLCDIERTVARIPPEVCEKDATRGHGDARVKHLVQQAPPPELLEELRRNVEHMEHRSRQLHSTCEALRKDREHLRQTVTTRQSELDAVLHILKEKEATIDKLRRDFTSVGAKTEEYCKTITEMSATVISLKESKEELLKKQEAMESRLRETEKELVKQTAELQLKNLETERMAAQLGARERELEICKQQLMEMKTLVRDQLTSLREAVRGGLPPRQIPLPSLTALEKQRPRLRTSSPTSSADSSQLSVSPSWHKISSITPPPDINADPVPTLPELTDLPDSQVSVTIGGPKAPAGRSSRREIRASRLVFRSLNQEDSGVGNEDSISKSMDDVRVLPITSEEEVDVVTTDGEPAKFLSKNLREMLEGLRKRSQQLGMPVDGIDFLKMPPPFPTLPPEPGGLSQISAPTDATDTSAAYASLSETETAVLKLDYGKGKNLIWPT